MHKLTHAQIVARQISENRKPKAPFAVILDNIRSLQNVGAIFRTADGAGVEKLWLCGITGYPPQGGIASTALGAEESVPWEYAKDASEIVRGYKTAGYQIVLLEQTDESVPYDGFIPRGPVCLVVGHEADGVTAGLTGLADAAIEIPMAGVKNSLNVAVAFGIAAFHLARSLRHRQEL
jgi:tRNA G18 (ribose-2'-O)-methylase SpoU